jgi:AraC family transcriptional regulator
VRGHMHFMHLYFLPEHFTQRAVQNSIASRAN